MALVKTPFLGEVVQVKGTNDLVLGGAKLAGYKALVDVLADGDTVYYRLQTISEKSGIPEWEVGLGTYTAATKTLARTTIVASSNSNNKVSFPANGAELVTVQSTGIAEGFAAYTLTNTGATSARTFDGNASSAATISATLSRLIKDLQDRGILA